MVEIYKALGDENRLRIINILMSYELCVCEIEVVLELTQSNVSRHLSKLKNIGILSLSKDAQWIHYELSKAFADKNDLLVKYIKLKFENDSLFQKDLNRCKIYKDSCYNCQTIASDKNLVAAYINTKMAEFN